MRPLNREYSSVATVALSAMPSWTASVGSGPNVDWPRVGLPESAQTRAPNRLPNYQPEWSVNYWSDRTSEGKFTWQKWYATTHSASTSRCVPFCCGGSWWSDIELDIFDINPLDNCFCWWKSYFARLRPVSGCMSSWITVVLPLPASPMTDTHLVDFNLECTCLSIYQPPFKFTLGKRTSSNNQLRPITSSRPTVPGCSNRSGRSISLIDGLFTWLVSFVVCVVEVVGCVVCGVSWWAASDRRESSRRMFNWECSIRETLCGRMPFDCSLLGSVITNLEERKNKRARITSCKQSQLRTWTSPFLYA